MFHEALSILLLFLLLVWSYSPSKLSSSRNLAFLFETPLAPDPANVQLKRPIMHTFFDMVPTLQNGEKGTGMTEQADTLMLELWKEKWQAIGWDTRVLTLKDAKRHPDYERYRARLEKVPLWGQKRAGVNRLYNQYCYLRWLAMATVGGWMSDYDVLPIAPLELGYDRFKVYSAGKEGRGIPCLMTGSAEQWNEMAYAILENGLAHQQDDLWSDMKALMDLKATRPYDCNVTVVDGARLLTGHSLTPNDCAILSRYAAVHFSHNTIQRGSLREGEHFRDRPTIARNVLTHYEQQCHGLSSVET